MLHWRRGQRVLERTPHPRFNVRRTVQREHLRWICNKVPDDGRVKVRRQSLRIVELARHRLSKRHMGSPLETEDALRHARQILAWWLLVGAVPFHVVQLLRLQTGAGVQFVGHRDRHQRHPA